MNVASGGWETWSWDESLYAGVFQGAGFRPAQTVTVADGRAVELTVDDVVARVFSMSSTAPHLFGDRREDYETDVREILTRASRSGRFSVRLPATSCGSGGDQPDRASHQEDGAVADQSEITFQLLDGAQAGERANELEALRAEEPCGGDDGRPFAERFRVLRRQPGFALAEARHGGYLVGYAFGMPLRTSTSWWRNLTAPLPDEVTTEHPGRTFALAELVVRASWRRQGIGATLHDRILKNRPEERATTAVRPAAAPAQQAFRKWGWRKVARTQDDGPASPVSDVLIRELPANR